MDELVKKILGIREDPPVPAGTNVVSYKELNSPKAKFERAIQAMQQKGWKVDGQEAPQQEPEQGVLGAVVQKLQEATGLRAGADNPTPTPAPDADEFEKQAIEILNQYQIPPSVGFGMRDAEGGRIGNNNRYNINATDSNPGGANNYETPEDGVRAFAELIAKNPRYKKAYDLRENPQQMMQAIQEAGYAGDPKTWRSRSIKTNGAGKDFKTYADFVQNTPGFKRYAN